MARRLHNAQKGNRQERDEQSVETKSCFNMAVQELMDCAQCSTAWAKQAGSFVKEAGWIEVGLRGVEKVKDGYTSSNYYSE